MHKNQSISFYTNANKCTITIYLFFRYNKCPLVSGIEECEKSFIGRENTGNHKNQAQIHPSPASFREFTAETNNPIERYEKSPKTALNILRRILQILKNEQKNVLLCGKLSMTRNCRDTL